MQPNKISKVIILRFYNSETALCDKFMILQVTSIFNINLLFRSYKMQSKNFQIILKNI